MIDPGSPGPFAPRGARRIQQRRSPMTTTANDPHAAPLDGLTLLISGGSRGVGLAIAVRAAQDGANVALLAKTAEPHPRLEGTVYIAAQEIERVGGEALPIVGDVRNEDDITRAVETTAERFGGIDIVVNNASAIDLSPYTELLSPYTELLSPYAELATKRFDPMRQIEVRGPS
jgi:citronellol/citronellal dehydrogenase